jgi:hypothetical protein
MLSSIFAGYNKGIKLFRELFEKPFFDFSVQSTFMYFEISTFRFVSQLVSALGDPKTILRFNDSLEGEQLCSQLCYIIITIMLLKSAKEKGA